MDVNDELKFLRKFTHKNIGGWGSGGRGGRVSGGSGWM